MRASPTRVSRLLNPPLRSDRRPPPLPPSLSRPPQTPPPLPPSPAAIRPATAAPSLGRRHSLPPSLPPSLSRSAGRSPLPLSTARCRPGARGVVREAGSHPPDAQPQEAGSTGRRLHRRRRSGDVQSSTDDATATPSLPLSACGRRAATSTPSAPRLHPCLPRRAPGPTCLPHLLDAARASASSPWRGTAPKRSTPSVPSRPPCFVLRRRTTSPSSSTRGMGTMTPPSRRSAAWSARARSRARTCTVVIAHPVAAAGGADGSPRFFPTGLGARGVGGGRCLRPGSGSVREAPPCRARTRWRRAP
ncbi:hypothetical protein C2845_PM07G21150 [Panicum miliaceum]|uniref:Uncharacterized protein n=1 Tax=Panicum miliaceum TaxID=4540 RepID=A0A3L6SME8_PANMI|nr:hypothetical protein C2845_PM07G21150 [Panicum miliaceum]